MIARPLGALALALLVNRPGAAQVVPQDTTPLAPIVISATRTPEPVATIANSVTILQGEELRRAGITTVADALRAVSGAAVVQQGSYGSVTSLFLRGGQSSYVRVLVDGVPLNMPGGSLDWSGLTTANVERIELVRGPASVVHGSDAVTGVVQILTRKGEGRGRVRAEARAGGYGSTDLAADLSAAGRIVGLNVGATRSETDGFYPYNSGFRNTTLSGVLSATPDARSDLRLAARWNDGRFRFPTDFAGVVSDTNQFQTSRGTTVSLDAGRFLASWLEVRTLLAFRESRDVSDNPPDTTTEFASRSEGLTDRRSADLRVNLHAATGTIVTVGGSVETERNRSSSTSSPTLATIVRTNRAGYAQLVTGIADRFWVQAGLRSEDNEAFGNFTTWRLGVVARVAGQMRLRANAGTAFKEPTFGENYNTAFSTGNPALKPERSSSWEVGLAQSLMSERVIVSAGYFDQRFRDLIQYVFAPAPQPNFFNIAGANARGVELQATVTPVRALRLRAEFTLLTTSVADSGYDGRQYEPGHRLIRRPTRSGSFSAELVPAGRVAGGLRALFVGSRDDLDFNQFPAARVLLAAYARFDAWAEVALLRTRGGADLALTGRVENLADAAYQEVFGYGTPGRRFLVGVRIGAGR